MTTVADSNKEDIGHINNILRIINLKKRNNTQKKCVDGVN